jgi:hypothetical protein
MSSIWIIIAIVLVLGFLTVGGFYLSKNLDFQKRDITSAEFKAIDELCVSNSSGCSATSVFRCISVEGVITHKVIYPCEDFAAAYVPFKSSLRTVYCGENPEPDITGWNEDCKKLQAGCEIRDLCIG